MGKITTLKKKRATERNKGLTAQDKKTLECILGICKHGPMGTAKCLYWDKVVDSSDPGREQLKLIIKLIGGIK